jgi:hypothetical protein
MTAFSDSLPAFQKRLENIAKVPNNQRIMSHQHSSMATEGDGKKNNEGLEQGNPNVQGLGQQQVEDSENAPNNVVLTRHDAKNNR